MNGMYMKNRIMYKLMRTGNEVWEVAQRVNGIVVEADNKKWDNYASEMITNGILNVFQENDRLDRGRSSRKIQAEISNLSSSIKRLQKVGLYLGCVERKEMEAEHAKTIAYFILIEGKPLLISADGYQPLLYFVAVELS